ncbi:MAG: DUF177 domain-containing protein [Proteobacteria bacterium]|nr:DUF177 domain-containing protein [Pseudomonadota bacterium]
MPSELPETIDPMRLAKTGKELSGSYDLHQLLRVNALLGADPDGQVSFRLKFFRDDESRLFCIIGRLEAMLPLVCQRCLQPMQHQLGGIVNMAIVSDEAEAESLPAQFEPYIESGLPVKLQDFVEDELLLAMPLVSLHEEKACPAADNPTENKSGRERIAKVNPFAELKNLKLRK